MIMDEWILGIWSMRWRVEKEGKRQWNLKNMREKFVMRMRVDGVGWESHGVFRDGHEVRRFVKIGDWGSEGCKDIKGWDCNCSLTLKQSHL